MATHGIRSRHIREAARITSDSESDSSSILSEEVRLSRPVCPWRTDRFHIDECSLYFDCPSHTIERALSETEEHSQGGGEDRITGGGRAEASLESAGDENNPGQSSAAPYSGAAPDLQSRSSAESREGVGPDTASGTAEDPIVLSDGDSPIQARSRDRSPPSPVVIEGEDLDIQTAQGRISQEAGTPITSSGLPSTGATGLTTDVAPRLAPATSTERRPQRMVLPRWQPDAEVTYCPICHTQFSIFIRKHHCRKCGRVVCNACSPHRITIPYQYIVQPPGTPRSLTPRHMTPFEGIGSDFSSLGGGERVRLCNPCVPDPNMTPPQPESRPGEIGHSRSQSGGGQRHASGSSVSNRWSSYFGAVPGPDAYTTRSRSATMTGNAASSSAASRHPSNPYSRLLSATPPSYFISGQSVAPRPYNDPRASSTYQALLGIGGSSRNPAAASSSSSSSPYFPQQNRSLPPIPQPRRQIAEEDECPVCHRELPERTLPNFEALREAHITICITAHSGYSGTPTGSIDAGGGETSSPPPPRRTGMFPYLATEKDCVDSAECSICLEEFEVGVPMARLECLCRFHRHCISAWWQRHPGRCPMHQHDSFGY